MYIPGNSQINQIEKNPNQVTSVANEKFSKSFIICFVIGWLIYIPSALIMLGLSAMISDNPKITNAAILFWITAINLPPFLFMLFLSRLSIKKRSVWLAILSPFVVMVTVKIIIFSIMFLIGLRKINF